MGIYLLNKACNVSFNNDFIYHNEKIGLASPPLSLPVPVVNDMCGGRIYRRNKRVHWYSEM